MKAETTGKEASLRERLIQVAGRLLVEEGYDSVSMRRVAQEAGCSQMATYRYFSNKEALIQHLCVQLYTSFTSRMYAEISKVEAPWDKIRIFVKALLDFAAAYPDHYSLIFLVRHSDKEVFEEREKLGREFLKGIRKIIADLLPASTSVSVIDSRMRQTLCILHGTAALLIAHPNAYRLSRSIAQKDAESAIASLMTS